MAGKSEDGKNMEFSFKHDGKIFLYSQNSKNIKTLKTLKKVSLNSELLLNAAYNGHYYMVKHLVLSGLNINKRGGILSYIETIEMIVWCLDHGAIVRHPRWYSLNPEINVFLAKEHIRHFNRYSGILNELVLLKCPGPEVSEYIVNQVSSMASIAEAILDEDKFF